jgi:hypothetical protein
MLSANTGKSAMLPAPLTGGGNVQQKFNVELA